MFLLSKPKHVCLQTAADTVGKYEMQLKKTMPLTRRAYFPLLLETCEVKACRAFQNSVMDVRASSRSQFAANYGGWAGGARNGESIVL